MEKILIVDDDEYIGNLEKEVLEKEGYSVLQAYSGTEALLLMEKENPDLVLLDLMLPGLSGEAVMSKISNVPVIVISAKADIDSKVDMLTVGACDYITKPFELREFVARVKAALRRNKPDRFSEQESNVYRDLILDDVLYKLFYNDKDGGRTELHLTPTEFSIIRILMQNRDRVVTKSRMLDEIAEYTPDCTDTSLKQHVSNLRKKIRTATGEDYIEAVWEIGFKLL